MLVLASARELMLLFVAFELMSIPLYFLTGFLKREDAAPEAALKFFLVGSVSSAVMLYGMSFIFGVTGTTELSAIPGALAAGNPLMRARPGRWCWPGSAFKIAALPFHMWVPDTYEAGGHAVRRLALGRAEGGRVHRRSSACISRASGAAALVWVPVVSAMAGLTIIAGNLMAIPQQNIKRLLAYSGIAHIGYMLIGVAALSATASGWCCSIWWRICSGTWARSSSSRRWRGRGHR